MTGTGFFIRLPPVPHSPSPLSPGPPLRGKAPHPGQLEQVLSRRGRNLLFTKILHYARHYARPMTHEDALNPYNHPGMKSEDIPISPPENRAQATCLRSKGRITDAQGRRTNFLTPASGLRGGGSDGVEVLRDASISPGKKNKAPSKG